MRCYKLRLLRPKKSCDCNKENPTAVPWKLAADDAYLKEKKGAWKHAWTSGGLSTEQSGTATTLITTFATVPLTAGSRTRSTRRWSDLVDEEEAEAFREYEATKNSGPPTADECEAPRAHLDGAGERI